MQTLLLLIVLYKTNWTNEVGAIFACKPDLTSNVTMNLDWEKRKLLQVKQTTERMKKWGGQDFQVGEKSPNHLASGNNEP